MTLRFRRFLRQRNFFMTWGTGSGNILEHFLLGFIFNISIKFEDFGINRINLPKVKKIGRFITAFTSLQNAVMTNLFKTCNRAQANHQSSLSWWWNQTMLTWFFLVSLSPDLLTGLCRTIKSEPCSCLNQAPLFQFIRVAQPSYRHQICAMFLRTKQIESIDSFVWMITSRRWSKM